MPSLRVHQEGGKVHIGDPVVLEHVVRLQLLVVSLVLDVARAVVHLRVLPQVRVLLRVLQ